MLHTLLLPLALAADPPAEPAAEPATPAPTFRWDHAVDTPLTLSAFGLWALAYTHAEADLHPGTDTSTPSGMDAWVSPRLNQSAHLGSDVLLYGTIGASLVGTSLVGLRAGEGGVGMGTRALLTVQTFAVNGVITETLKVAYDRPRPYTALDPQTLEGEDAAKWAELMDEGDSWKSFPSGHTSMVAALSLGWARQVHLSGASRGVSTLGYALAAAATVGTGALRVSAGRHHPSDVLAGALVGGAVGWLVPTVHLADLPVQISAGGRSVTVQARF